MRETLHADLEGAAFLDYVQGHTMLREDVILALIWEGANTTGPVLEVGSFIGGSSLALMFGCEVSGQPFRSIELGGARTDHEDPRFFTSDIHASWGKAVTGYYPLQVARSVLIKGGYDDDEVRASVREWLDGRSLGVLFIDADGHLDRTVGSLGDHLDEATRLVIDDYQTPVSKQYMIKPVVDAHCAAGFWRPDAEPLVDGTWFGQCRPAIEKIAQRRLRIVRLLEPEEAGITPPGYAIYLAGSAFGQGDDREDPRRSRLRLLEDERDIGPAHTPAAEIERLGGGAYAHWRKTLYFSATDDTDPLTNSHTYAVRTEDGAAVDLIFCRAEPAKPAPVPKEEDASPSAPASSPAESPPPDWPRWLQPAVRRIRLVTPPQLRSLLRRVFLG